MNLCGGTAVAEERRFIIFAETPLGKGSRGQADGLSTKPRMTDKSAINTAVKIDKDKVLRLCKGLTQNEMLKREKDTRLYYFQPYALSGNFDVRSLPQLSLRQRPSAGTLIRPTTSSPILPK